MGFRENLKSVLDESGMPVKELAAKSGIKKNTIDQYLSARSQLPSVETGVKIAQALGVSVEYLVTGEEKQNNAIQNLSKTSRQIIHYAEKMDDKKMAFVLDFIKWLLSWEERVDIH